MKLALIRADADNSTGIGHIIRTMDITRELQKNNYEVLFLTKESTIGSYLLKENNFRYYPLKHQNNFLKSSIDDFTKLFNIYGKVNIIIIDLFDFNKKYDQISFDKLKKFCKKLIVFSDETEPLNINANIVFAFSINQKPEYYKDVKNTKYFTGLKYVALKPEYQNVQKKIIAKDVKNILVTFGGIDHRYFTEKVMKILNDLNINATIIIVAGPGFNNERYDKLKQHKPENIITERNIKDLLKYFIEADFCICSAGTTLIELLTCGVPCIVLPQTMRENDHAKTMEKKDMIINLGLNFKDKDLIREVKNLMSDYLKRRSLSESAQNYFDGKGIRRIIQILLQDDD